MASGAVVDFYWNDAWLHAAAREAYTISVAEAATIARERAPWRHVAASVSPTADGIRVSAPDRNLAEKGAGRHEIEGTGQVAKFRTGGFATGPISHPGFRGTPFMAPAAEAWPELYVQAAKGTFPG